jgi:hypothetical protein
MPLIAKTWPLARTPVAEPAADEGRYKLRPGVPEPLSRLALQRMRRPASDEPKLEFEHMRSGTFKRIHFELLRYCRGEIDGLSVLIAGQRGAGKTTLAKLVIQEVMRDSDGLIPLPLLLHGPTIIDPEAITPEAKDNDLADNSWEKQARLSYKDVDDAPSTAPQEKQRALRQIITALYRSLSTAIYDAWLNAAEEAPEARRAQGELLGLRAHLDLRLERAPDPDVLRKIWGRAGFLQSGVAFYLRPMKGEPDNLTRDVEVPQIAGHRKDQGLREIVALSACADAYRVILGDTEERLRREQRRQDEQELRVPGPAAPESKKGAQDGKTKSTAEKLGPPAIGTMAGALAGMSHDGNIGWGLAIGSAVWLASWAATVYGVRRTTQDTSREMTLRIRWDIDRLERDLPVLLKRIKDAGFAPIFVLDELDKASNAVTALENFLKLTKHIVTDHAAFLFLTNRDYFERLFISEQTDIGTAR